MPTVTKTKTNSKKSAPKSSQPAVDKSAKPSKSKKESPRDILYPDVSVMVCVGKESLTVAQAKQLLGWQEESDNIKFGNSYLLHDTQQRKIRCYNNVINRPLYSVVYLTLKQEHLRRKWHMNGEPVIIGKTGLVLNGQHQLISLILAAQEWSAHQGKWKEYWDVEPTMDKLVVFGIDEADEVVNTMDTCKPRSLSDVIYRSVYFADRPPRERRTAATMTDHAVRLLWHRTGASLDAFAPRRTHSESLDFIARHPRLLAAVRHIQEENDTENKIGKFIPVGYASGLCYLMAASATEGEKESRDGYTQVERACEEQIDFKYWDRACEFWVLLAAGAAELAPIRAAIVALCEERSASFAERCALIAKAWVAFSQGKPVTAAALLLEYEDDANGILVLAETPIVGGIDLGEPVR